VKALGCGIEDTLSSGADPVSTLSPSGGKEWGAGQRPAFFKAGEGSDAAALQGGR